MSESNSVFIEGFGIGGYRNFLELQKIGPCERVNILIGKNNTGKTNVLKFICRHYSKLYTTIKSYSGRGTPKNIEFGNLPADDLPQGHGDLPLQIAFCIKKDGAAIKSLDKRVTSFQDAERNRYDIYSLFEVGGLSEHDSLWIAYAQEKKPRFNVKCDGYLAAIRNDIQQENILPQGFWSLLSRKMLSIGVARFDDAVTQPL